MGPISLKFFCTVQLVCVTLLAVTATAPTLANGESLRITYANWLARLRSIVKEAPPSLGECFFNKGVQHVALSVNIAKPWSAQTGASNYWRNYQPSNIKKAQLSAKYGGVVISSINGHVHGPGTFNARFTFDNVAPFQSNWGAYHAYSLKSFWPPFSFVQMFAVPCGRQSEKINVRLQIKSPNWYINGAGHVIAVLPPPSFLSSRQSSAVSVKSAQTPVKIFGTTSR